MDKPQLFISLARMHHIVNPAKYRRLRRHAVHTNISGLVKVGRPGVLVFDGDKESISSFLEAARGLRYLDFHHVNTRPFPPNATSRIARSEIGLREVADMKTLVDELDAIGLKSWFRTHMGMEKGP